MFRQPSWMRKGHRVQKNDIWSKGPDFFFSLRKLHDQTPSGSEMAANPILMVKRNGFPLLHSKINTFPLIFYISRCRIIRSTYLQIFTSLGAQTAQKSQPPWSLADLAERPLWGCCLWSRTTLITGFPVWDRDELNLDFLHENRKFRLTWTVNAYIFVARWEIGISYLFLYLFLAKIQENIP